MRSLDAPAHDGPKTLRPLTGKLRFQERWSIDLEGLDADGMYLCGDRLVVAGPKRALALDRTDGSLLWVREGLGGPSFMAERTLLRQSSEGVLELCDVGDGEAFATARIAPRSGGMPLALSAGGGKTPPMAVLAEGASRLVAIDLRNGELRWRFVAREGNFRLARAGRLLIVSAGDGSISAIDVTTGEEAWRFTESVKFRFQPCVSPDLILTVSGEPGSGSGEIFAIDRYSGSLRWKRTLSDAPTAAPVLGGGHAVASVSSRAPRTEAFGLKEGTVSWCAPAAGLAVGAGSLLVDDRLIVNAPGGRVSAIDLATGETAWSETLADPVADEIPRALGPVLRGGALFVPAAAVHVLRPTDGSAIGPALPCDLIPDAVRVDERGWVYVAEDSGRVSAMAPRAVLSLVKS